MVNCNPDAYPESTSLSTLKACSAIKWTEDDIGRIHFKLLTTLPLKYKGHY